MAGMTTFLLLLWLGATVSTAVDLQKRIVGGQDCTDNEALYHVKITDPAGKLLCGGTLINKKWVLTAAHCWMPNVKVDVSLHRSKAQTGINVAISAAPVMYQDKKKKSHDIMLLRLPSSTDVEPVKLPDCGGTVFTKKKSIIGDLVQIAGYGAASEEGQSESSEPGNLQCKDMKVVACEKSSSVNAHHHTLCGKADGLQICSTDSGGGVVYKGEIFGVISHTGGEACTESAEFLNVCEYLDWIKKSTKKSIGKSIKKFFKGK